jgi:hypothetical protein
MDKSDTMKRAYTIRTTILSMIFGLVAFSCEQDFPNPNNPTEEVVLTTKEGLFALSIGINQYYSTSALRQIIEAPGITTREFGVTNTFQNLYELARGGDELSGDSDGVTPPFVRLTRSKGMVESLLSNLDEVELSESTRASILAYGNLYKAMTLGYLIQLFEQAPINNSSDGKAIYSDRTAVLNECISLLEAGRDAINANSVSSEFQRAVLDGNIDLLATTNAFLSRYHLLAGNYSEAITSADAALTSSQTSVFKYDENNVNPIWDRTVNSSSLDPQSNFGLTNANHLPEAGDGRIAFYLGGAKGTALEDAGGQPLSNMQGFFATSTSDIPVYLPGEMILNKAEAYARSNDLPNAVAQIDLIRTKTNDPFGVNAGLAAWTGNASDQTEVLEEIYKNRCIELFLTGMRLEDSRRFHPDLLTSPNPANTTNERNRNYYPYPTIERENNPNTPANPAI